MVLLVRRHDHLGGRLTAMCLALIAGRTHGIPVKLTWPQSALYRISVPVEDVFSQSFLETHWMPEEQVVSEDAVHSGKYRIVDALMPNQLPADLAVPRVPLFSDMLPESCLHPDLRDACMHLRTQSYRAVHVRHGDLVRGNWRHFGHMKRFVPYDAIHDYIARNCPEGEYRVQSDEPDAAMQLAQVAGQDPYAYVKSRPLNGLSPDLFDAFNMAFAETIVAPSSSAYSGFAARYRGAPRRTMSEAAFSGWAEREVAEPRIILDAAYTAKRHLFIAEILEVSGRAPAYLSQIRRLLDHAEDTYPDTAETFLARMRLYHILPDPRSFEELGRLFVEKIAEISDRRMLRQGITVMDYMKRTVEKQRPNEAATLTALQSYAEAVLSNPDPKNVSA